MQQHSCHNSSQQGSIIGGLHHVVDSSRLTKSQTGDIHHHVNPRCIDVARYARGSDHGEHPRSEDKPRKPPIESNRLGSISLGSISRALTAQHTAPQRQQFVDISADELAPGLHSYRARTAGRAHSECRPGFYWVTADGSKAARRGQQTSLWGTARGVARPCRRNQNCASLSRK